MKLSQLNRDRWAHVQAIRARKALPQATRNDARRVGRLLRAAERTIEHCHRTHGDGCLCSVCEVGGQKLPALVKVALMFS